MAGKWRRALTRRDNFQSSGCTRCPQSCFHFQPPKRTGSLSRLCITADRYAHKEKEIYFTASPNTTQDCRLSSEVIRDRRQSRTSHGNYSMLHYKWVCESYLHEKKFGVDIKNTGGVWLLLIKLLLQCRKTGHGLCRLHQLHEHCIGFISHDLSFFGCSPRPVDVCVCIGRTQHRPT